MHDFSKIVIVSLFAITVRWCVSLSSYSGAGKPPMFGDYEAQRHWMEITVNLPVQEWYQNSSNNNLMYWGLDYPPLTAYHSYLCGVIARFINPDWVAINSSRGFESYQHKLFMRYTVLIADILVYFPMVYLALYTTKPSSTRDPNSLVTNYALMLMYPGLILIDHGHFQYNCISLGLALAAVACLATSHVVWCSVLFCLALNYKQMELYHAMPFFCFLLGSCLKNSIRGGLTRLTMIGVSVIVTFGICWAPFLCSINTAQQVLHRLFPFARGVFEDKVSNIWCSLSVLIKWKQIMSQENIVKMCLGTTAVCILPSSLDLLVHPSIQKFRYAIVNSALVFFLCSFQVHEKSILIPALFVCPLIPDHPLWCSWFLFISTFSMLPLLLKDGLLVPYISLMIIYSILVYSLYPSQSKYSSVQEPKSTVWARIITNLLFCMSLVGMVILTIVTVLIPPLDHLPDLFPLLISIYSCGNFILFTLYFHYCQFMVTPYKPAVDYSNENNTKSSVIPSNVSRKITKMARKAKAAKSKKKKYD